MSGRHCWFDFEDGGWTDDGERIPGHTCMLEDGHDGPHEPTSDNKVWVGFKLPDEKLREVIESAVSESAFLPSELRSSVVDAVLRKVAEHLTRENN